MVYDEANEEEKANLVLPRHHDSFYAPGLLQVPKQHA